MRLEDEYINLLNKLKNYQQLKENKAIRYILVVNVFTWLASRESSTIIISPSKFFTVDFYNK